MDNKIRIRGARENNLKNVSIDIPKNKLVVFTGLSGSGKSSLAFNTLYAEGHRRYVESLSAYARQFLGQLEKPKVDSIDGLSPTIAIDQKTASRNPRSTVGTVTEIYDHLRLLYARAGTVMCPNGHGEIKSQTVSEIVDQIMTLPEGTKLQILSPIIRGKKGEHVGIFEEMKKQGFIRARIDGEIRDLEEDIKLEKTYKHTIEAVVDRLKMKETIESRLSDSVELALQMGNGLVIVLTDEGEMLYSQNHSCKECNFSFEEIEPRTFSFNSPYGACPTCKGLGLIKELNMDKSIDESLSIEEGCFLPIKNVAFYTQILREFCKVHKIPMSTPYKSLTKKQKGLLLNGSPKPFRVSYTNLWGQTNIHPFNQGLGGVKKIISSKYKEQDETPEDLENQDGVFIYVPCDHCKGARLKPELLSVHINDLSIIDVCNLSISDSLQFFSTLTFTDSRQTIAAQLLKEITSRLVFLNEVGLDYLTLSRNATTLSGGEAQRIRLATQIGSGLTGVLYVLDEPSIGLHQRDNDRLLESLKRLRDLGNTLIIVEHDEDTMRMADYIVDIGPRSGEQGGEIVAEGTFDDIIKADSLTADYLSGRKEIPVPSVRRKPTAFIDIKGAKENNLKGISTSFPLGVLCSVTGVSGSGKSTLVNQILYPSLQNHLNRSSKPVGAHKEVVGAEQIDKIINIDQSPIGRTPRSNPSTYIGVFDEIRKLYAQTNDAKTKGYTVGRFSFNVPKKNGGGRCEACRGDGVQKVEMHFLSDVYVTCDVCKGKRYERETLNVLYKGKNINDILLMTAEEGLHFFEHIPRIKNKLKTLVDVGLGYIRLGQPATTLSGGEAQRIKLASELSKRSTGKTFYVLDEPTTGLHIYDVHNLLKVLERLVEKGNTVLVIEHNLDVIKYSDYLIDLGPEGGDKGGKIVAKGTPEKVASEKGSYTGHYLNKLGL
ncbi:excinuclease ABC subunit A [Priestia megaterium]|nr:excinuclease ABC subunit A [Priestia megaterium]